MNLSNRLNNPLVKKHMLVIALGLFLGLMLYNYFDVSIYTSEKLHNTSQLVLSAIGGVFLAYITYFTSLKLDKVFPWKTKLANRIVSGIFSLFIINFLVIYALVNAYIAIFQNSELDENLYKNNLIKLGIILFILMLIYTIIYFAFYSYYSYSKLQIEAVKFERKQYELQLNALKTQLSPHFLFNNLNTISSLAFKNAELAESYIRGLASIYNYSLNSYHTKLVTLREELEVVSAYLSLLETRFGSFLKFSIEISKPDLDNKIPPLTLQMLVENAVKHNQISESNPLSIQVFEEQSYIVVKNNITEAPKKISSFNIGLNNINSRFKLISKKEIIIKKDTNYIVKVPLISS